MPTAKMEIHNDEMARWEKMKPKHAKQTKAQIISMKFHAAVWVVAAGLTWHYLQVIPTMSTDVRVKRGYLHTALLCFGLNVCITLYLAIWLPYVKHNHLAWSVYCPRMIPLATLSGTIFTLCFNIAMWPVWGFFTPIILFVLFLGTIMVAHFLPSI